MWTFDGSDLFLIPLEGHWCFQNFEIPKNNGVIKGAKKFSVFYA